MGVLEPTFQNSSRQNIRRHGRCNHNDAATNHPPVKGVKGRHCETGVGKWHSWTWPNYWGYYFTTNTWQWCSKSARCDIYIPTPVKQPCSSIPKHDTYSNCFVMFRCQAALGWGRPNIAQDMIYLNRPIFGGYLESPVHEKTSKLPMVSTVTATPVMTDRSWGPVALLVNCMLTASPIRAQYRGNHGWRRDDRRSDSTVWI